jgi:multidrug efflux pump subunit AcrA (membrane-fusion protein)
LDIKRAPVNKTRKRIIYGGGGLLALVAITVALSKLQPAAPTVDSAPWMDTVKRGAMVIQVRGPGTLVPEQIQYITALTPGRVERVLVRPPAVVTATTVIVELSNPDVQIQLLQAQQQLSQAQAALVSLRSTLETQRLNQQSAVAGARAAARDAQRNAISADSLEKAKLIAPNDLSRLRDLAAQTADQLRIQEQQLQIVTETAQGQIDAQQGQVQRLKAIADFQMQRTREMRITAGAAGVLQDLTLESGQWVQSGTQLARVAQPGKLKAVLRIPETQAPDVALGQPAAVDTRNGIVQGHVMRIDPAAQGGTVAVDIALDSVLPRGTRPDQSVDGTIDIQRLTDVVYVGRPAFGQPNATVGLFRLAADGHYADRVNVKLGRSSVNLIEILDGLKPGDVVILSDMSRWDAVDRVRVN